MKRKEFIKQMGTMSLGITGFTSFISTHPKENMFRDFPIQNTSKLINVACAISENTTSIDWIGPQSVFEVWHFNAALNKYEKKFNIFTVAKSLSPVGNILPRYTFETCPAPQIVVVPAQRGSKELLDWLNKIHPTSQVTMSVCIGAKHLADAGLLDGGKATTHHKSIDQYSKEYTNVEWIKNVRFVQHNNIFTAGGLTAGIDLSLHIVEMYFNRNTALQVADHLEYQGKGWITNQY